MWEPFLRLDVLSLAFIYRRFSNKIYDNIEFGMKDCLKNLSLGRKRKCLWVEMNLFTHITIKTHEVSSGKLATEEELLKNYKNLK